jgi:hypothetical protein
MLKNARFDSKDQSAQFFFVIHHFGGSKHSSISALPGLDRKKIILNLLAYSYVSKSEVSD